jgi:indolepyruvate ferredoxin oxidoreductase beta subunit
MVPGISIAEELGNVRVNNVVILGALSRRLDIDIKIWEKVIAERVPARYVELNLKAFSMGRKF